MSGYLVISADSQAGPSASQCREHLDHACREAFDLHQAQLLELLETFRGSESGEDVVDRWVGTDTQSLLKFLSAVEGDGFDAAEASMPYAGSRDETAG
jgi:hypothetical protein